VSDRKTSVAEQVKRRVQSSQNEFWTADDFDAASRTAVLRELSRLADEGELRSVRKGLYWRGQKTRLGMTPPQGEDVVRHAVGSGGVGPAAWTASLALGLSTQHPRVETVAVPKRLRALGSVEIKDRSGREFRRRERLNRYEVALLEVLEDWERYVDIPQAAALDRLEHWIDSKTIRVDKLVKAAKTEPPAVRENLRGLLHATGRSNEAERVRPAATPAVRERSPLAHAA
jgi:hypothetical protein